MNACVDTHSYKELIYYQQLKKKKTQKAQKLLEKFEKWWQFYTFFLHFSKQPRLETGEVRNREIKNRKLEMHKKGGGGCIGRKVDF